MTKRLSVTMDSALAEAIESAALRNNRSVAQEISARLEQSLGADVVVLWVTGHWGELDDRHCPKCGEEIAQPYVGLLANGGVYGPVCQMCATSN